MPTFDGPDDDLSPRLKSHEFRFAVPDHGEVSAVLLNPPKPHALFVLAHGAGAGMKHPFLETLAQELAGTGVGTLRYQFPYMENRRKAPDTPKVLTATVREAVRAAIEHAGDVPLFAGGKSMGGRMTSLAASQQPLDKVHGLIFVGFPLHPPGKKGTERADHLKSIALPMLFLQGTRDPLADLDLLRPICAALRPAATLNRRVGHPQSQNICALGSGPARPRVMESRGKIPA